jgi:hypothetical protein
MVKNTTGMKFLPLCILFLVVTSSANAKFQYDSLFQRSPALYLEILGNGGLYSFNYENNFGKKWNYRVGVLYQWGPSTGPGLVPEVFYLIGRRQKIEIGAGISIRYLKDRDDSFSNYDQDFFIYNTLRLGYRMSKNNSKLLLKVSVLMFATIYDPSETWSIYPSIGLAIGQKLGKK